MHRLASGGEAAAIKVMADAVTAAGILSVDDAIADDDNVLPIIISWITSGDPEAAVSHPLRWFVRKVEQSGRLGAFPKAYGSNADPDCLGSEHLAT